MKKIYLRPREGDSLAVELGKNTLSAYDFDVCFGAIPSDASAVVSNNISAEELANLPRLEALFVYKTGVEKLPLKELRERGIKVFNSHANADVIAEHAVALAMCLTHKLIANHLNLKEGVWQIKDYYWDTLRGKRVGILGYGCVGRAIANILRAFGCEICVLDRGKKYEEQLCKCATVDDLLKSSDVLFLALPQTEQTKNILNACNLKYLKDCYVVNVGRAGAIDEAALFEALKNGDIKGYASDSWIQSKDKGDPSKRVYPSSLPYHTLPNVVLSPHNATHDVDGHRRYLNDALSKVAAYMSGRRVDCVDLTKGY